MFNTAARAYFMVMCQHFSEFTGIVMNKSHVYTHDFLCMCVCVCVSSLSVETSFLCINQGITCHNSCIISERCLKAFFLTAYE
jgi:hypothetical protein